MQRTATVRPSARGMGGAAGPDVVPLRGEPLQRLVPVGAEVVVAAPMLLAPLTGRVEPEGNLSARFRVPMIEVPPG